MRQASRSQGINLVTVQGDLAEATNGVRPGRDEPGGFSSTVYRGLDKDYN